MEWLLICFVGMTAVAFVNRFVIGILFSGHSALREDRPLIELERRKPRFGWIMVRLPAVPMLEHRSTPDGPPPSRNSSRNRRLHWWWAGRR